MSIKDPRYYPWTLNSPYEIYAAGRWFGSREDPSWQNRAHGWAEQNSPLYRGEFSVSKFTEITALSLVKELFFLHITVRTGSPRISEALAFLKNLEGSQGHRGRKTFDIPFEAAEDSNFVIHAWLFTAAVFGEADSVFWRESAERMGREIQTDGKNCNSCSLYNFLRGTLILPEAEQIPGVTDAVRLLAKRQEPSGFWKDLSPWQVYNLMAHSTIPDALKILEKLETPLLERQNQDGSWGRGKQKPLAAFLMAHGLQNRGRFAL